MIPHGRALNPIGLDGTFQLVVQRMLAMNLCDYCESRLTRMTTATSCCDNCGCKFYVDSSDGHPIHRTTGPTRPDAPSSSEIRINTRQADRT